MTLSDLKALWRNHPKALSGFVLGAAVTLFFAIRFITSAIHWHDPAHFHEPVKSWMTLGYVAKSWHVYTKDIAEGLGLPPPVKGHPLTIRDIALQRGISEADAVKLVQDAVNRLRAGTPKP